MKDIVQGNVSKEFQLGNVKVELSKTDLENMLKELSDKVVEEYYYPICCKHKHNGTIVLFESLCNGRILKDNYEFTSHTINTFSLFEHHTNNSTWEEIPYDKERGLYHGQWVWCWDYNYSHQLTIRQYDAINKCSFSCNGNENSYEYTNYSATCPEHMKEALQDIINNEKALGTVGIEF